MKFTSAKILFSFFSITIFLLISIGTGNRLNISKPSMFINVIDNINSQAHAESNIKINNSVSAGAIKLKLLVNTLV